MSGSGNTAAPTDAEVIATLGPAKDVWNAIVAEVAERYAPLECEWRPSKSDFGRMCLLKCRKRTLAYLTPGADAVTVAIVLGKRAVEAALKSHVPARIKTAIKEARAYAEGSGIRFAVGAMEEIPIVLDLIRLKTASK